MNTIILKCLHSKSENIVRDGFTPKRKQRYWCHDRQRVSRENPEQRGYTEDEKERILQAYEEHSSMRGLERVFGVSRKTVDVWLKKRSRAPSFKRHTAAARTSRQNGHRLGTGSTLVIRFQVESQALDLDRLVLSPPPSRGVCRRRPERTHLPQALGAGA